MNINNIIENGICFISYAGRIDTATSTEFQKTISEISEKNKLIAFDFSKITYISSAGLRAILMIVKQQTAIKGKLAIFEMTDSIKEIFDMSGFSTIIKVFDTKENAVSWLNG